MLAPSTAIVVAVSKVEPPCPLYRDRPACWSGPAACSCPLRQVDGIGPAGVGDAVVGPGRGGRVIGGHVRADQRACSTGLADGDRDRGAGVRIVMLTVSAPSTTTVVAVSKLEPPYHCRGSPRVLVWTSSLWLPAGRSMA